MTMGGGALHEPARRSRHGDVVREARKERRRVAAAALLSLGYSAAQLAGGGLADSDEDESLPSVEKLSKLSAQLAHSSGLGAAPPRSTGRNHSPDRANAPRGSSPEQKRATEGGLSPVNTQLAEEEYSKLEALAGELAAELEAEKNARADAETALERLRKSERTQAARHQRKLREAKEEHHSYSTAADVSPDHVDGGGGDRAASSSPKRARARARAGARKAANGSSRKRTGGRSRRETVESVRSRRSSHDSSASSISSDGGDEAEDGESAAVAAVNGAAVIECTRSVGCKCPQCDMSAVSISQIDLPQPERRWSGAALPDSLATLDENQRRAPLHAYTQWLVEDCVEQRMRRLVATACQRWRVWARACRTVKQVWAKKLGGLSQQMFACWREWAAKRALGRAEVTKRLEREVEKATTAAKIAEHHYERQHHGGKGPDPFDIGAAGPRGGGSGRGSPNGKGGNGSVGTLEHVQALQERADFAQRQQAAVLGGEMRVSEALQAVLEALGGTAAAAAAVSSPGSGLTKPRRSSPTRRPLAQQQEARSSSRTSGRSRVGRGGSSGGASAAGGGGKRSSGGGGGGRGSPPSRLHAKTGSSPNRRGVGARSPQLPPM